MVSVHESAPALKLCSVDAQFLDASHVPSLAAAQVLVSMGLSADAPLLPGVPSCALDFGPLHAPVCEVWTSNQPVSHCREENLELGWNGHVLMGVIQFENTEHELIQRTQEAYDRIFAVCERRGYPNLCRMWNFIPNINGTDAHGMERYRAFCMGRAHAFFEDNHYGELFLPAGTGVGLRSGKVTVIFMAVATAQHVNFENPRQMPAYHYPRQYGPKSPSFARGTLVRGMGEPRLYVSGTSSILGHETVFAGDVVRQTQTSLDNIEYLMSSENLARYGLSEHAGLQDLDQIKVYLRRSEDLAAVRALCEASFSAGTKVVYLGADICRSDLLVEIEAVARPRV